MSKRIYTVTGAKGSGKSTVVAFYLPPSQIHRAVIVDTEDSMSDILDNLERNGKSFGRYIRMYDRFSGLQNNAMINAIAEGKLPWVDTGIKQSALVQYWEYLTEVLAETLGIPVEVAVMSDIPAEPPKWVISTLPGGVVAEIPGLDVVAGSSTLFDIAYDPWPSTLASLWQSAGASVISGLEMLVYQALAQIRAFVNADTSVPLEREPEIIDAMRLSVGLEPPSHPGV